MEVVGSHKRGLMKSKLVMSFYRAAKPTPSTVQCAAVTAVKPIRAASQLVSFRHDDDDDDHHHHHHVKSEDGYIHGPNGGGGDEHVDNRATSYIFQVKERLKLEESNLIINGNH
ncbi:hypothetical protein ABFS82_05G000600 [Erythranthe guttata]